MLENNIVKEIQNKGFKGYLLPWDLETEEFTKDHEVRPRKGISKTYICSMDLAKMIFEKFKDFSETYQKLLNKKLEDIHENGWKLIDIKYSLDYFLKFYLKHQISKS
mgnify:CR=1 FL=1